MNNSILKVRARSMKPALRGTIVLLMSGGALVAATNMRASEARGGWMTRSGDREAAREAEAHVTELLSAMRGTSPVACRLATRALQNNWGNGRGMIAGPESIGAAGDSIFDWAVSEMMDAAVIPQLRSALDDADPCVRRTAASLLGRTRPSNGLASDLGSQLSSANARTREAAFMAIGYAGRKDDRTAAERGLRDSDNAVKVAAVWATGRIGDAASVPALIELLKEGDETMRANAAYALGELESPAAIPSLVALLGSDTQPVVRRAAAQALGRIEQ
jgi:hypothetical protein